MCVCVCVCVCAVFSAFLDTSTNGWIHDVIVCRREREEGGIGMEREKKRWRERAGRDSLLTE